MSKKAPAVTDVSVDLETLATSTSAVILSIGIASNAGHKFHLALDVDEQIAMGRHVSASTFQWWLGDASGEDARVSYLALLAKRAPSSVSTARSELLAFFAKLEKENPRYRIWGNGPSFDLEILGSFIGAKPWQFFQERDVRTARMLVKSRTAPAVAHDALADAEAQLEDIMRFVQMTFEG